MVTSLKDVYHASTHSYHQAALVCSLKGKENQFNYRHMGLWYLARKYIVISFGTADF